MCLLVVVLSALLFLPPWMLPRATAMLPLAPVQNPSEEESHSSHSAAAQLQQLSAIFGGKIGRPSARPIRIVLPLRLGSATLALDRPRARVQSELARRNGCGGPLRC
jgi:hypothetical protein